MKSKLFTVTLALSLSVSAPAANDSSFWFKTGSVAIPDNDPNGFQDTRLLSGLPGPIADVNVTLSIAGGLNGDLYAWLSHGTGLSVLLNRVGRSSIRELGYADVGFGVDAQLRRFTLDDQVSRDVHLYQAGPYTLNTAGQLTGVWQPDGRILDPESPASMFDTAPRPNPLSVINGLDPNGEWTLFLADLSAGRISTLTEWGLHITVVPEPSTFALAGLGAALLGTLRQRNRRLLVVSGALLLGTALQADPPVTADDQASTLQDTAITIPVLANDSDAATNQLAILRVTKPMHGSVLINLNGAAANPELSRLLQFAGIQLSNSVVEIASTNLYPRATGTNGAWETYPVGIYNWVSGFLPGCLWYLYEQTGDANYRAWAESWMAGIAPMQYATEVDDVSFMINTSFGNGHRLTGNPDWKAVVLRTAQSFSTRYNSAAGCLSTWGAVTNAPVQVFIDTMMNLEVLFRAFDLGGDTKFYNCAYSHAEKTMLNHVRPDGSTYQIVDYDGKTGAVIFRGTFYGASDESTWARGHAWAVYGFTLAYRETGDPRFLTTAQRLADYFLANVPSDYVPYWDFQAPGIPNAPRDSSAASITLSALVQLSQLTTNLQDGARYWQAARHILSSLSSTNYLAQGTPSRGILLHGVGEPPASYAPEIDVSLIYADYYFLEAVKRYRDTYCHTTLTYVPDAGFQGTDTFTYQACNSAGNCATASVTVVVEPTAPSPFAAQISLSPTNRIPTISFPSTAGRLYHVQSLNDLPAAGSWSILASNIAGSGSLMSVSDTNPPSHRFYRVGVETPITPPQDITLEAPLGTITAPFIIAGTYIYQPIQTNLANAGRAAYSFNILNAGDYVISATVNAPGDGANSFFLNIDAEPQDPYMIWDIPVTAGFEQRLVSWRGNGTFDNNQFVPKVFTLGPGAHQLIIRGREAVTMLQRMVITRYP